MKKFINKILLVFAVTASLFSCEEVDNAIYDVFDNTQRGAVLRTIERVSSNFNIFDPSSTWEIIIEEQDVENGGLLSKVDVYVSFTDNKADGVDNSRSESMLTSIAASEFGKSDNGLPITNISATLAEVTGLLGLADGQYNGGDVFTFRLEVVLTDGRSFSADDTSGTLQGSFLASPYSYDAGLLCIPLSPITGDYVIDMQDGYGDGWQGSKITVTIDGVATDYSLPDLWTAGLGGSVGDAQYVSGSVTVTVPGGAQELSFTFTGGDYPSEVTFQIYTPSGFLGVDAGPSPPVGEIALNLCNE